MDLITTIILDLVPMGARNLIVSPSPPMPQQTEPPVSPLGAPGDAGHAAVLDALLAQLLSQHEALVASTKLIVGDARMVNRWRFNQFDSLSV